MGFMFEIVNATAGYVLFFTTNEIRGELKYSFPKLMVMILQKFKLCLFQLVVEIFCAVCIMYPFYELREIQRVERIKEEERQQNDYIELE